MAAPTFRSVASALVTHLDAALTYLTTCRLYAGEVEDIGNGQPFDAAPACFVIFDGMDAQPEFDTFDAYTYLARYGVVVVAASLGGRTAVEESDTHSAHDIIEDVLAAIPNDDLDLTDFAGLTPGSVRRVKITSTLAVYVVEFTGYVSVAK